jgi:hypothetical protein
MSGVEALDRVLTAYSIAHTYETYEGDHLNRIDTRFEKNVLPFFARNLKFEPQRTKAAERRWLVLHREST